jgi:hypothetical protein
LLAIHPHSKLWGILAFSRELLLLGVEEPVRGAVGLEDVAAWAQREIPSGTRVAQRTRILLQGGQELPVAVDALVADLLVAQIQRLPELSAVGLTATSLPSPSSAPTMTATSGPAALDGEETGGGLNCSTVPLLRPPETLLETIEKRFTCMLRGNGWGNPCLESNGVKHDANEAILRDAVSAFQRAVGCWTP